MFKNLYISDPTFAEHNFMLRESELRKVSDPAWDVEEALRSRHGYIPGLAETLSTTLSAECCASFIRANPDLPITDRDYYLSKLFQFLYQSLLDESDGSSHWHEARGILEAGLDRAFPEGVQGLWNRLPDLDWLRFFQGYRHNDLEHLTEQIASYLLPRRSTAKAAATDEKRGVQVVHSRRGSRSINAPQAAAKLEKFMESRGLDRSELAARMKGRLSGRTIQNFLNTHNAASRTLTAIAQTMNISKDELLANE